MIGSKLKELKELRKMSTNEISKRSGIPASTISRILSEQTESASFDNICGIAIALDGSIDELIGISKTQKDKHSEELLDLYKDELKHERKLNRKLITLLVIVFLILFFVMVFDVLNGGIGYIRY